MNLHVVHDLIDHLKRSGEELPRPVLWFAAFGESLEPIRQFIGYYLSNTATDDLPVGKANGKLRPCLDNAVFLEFVKQNPNTAAVILSNMISLHIMIRNGAKAFAEQPESEKPDDSTPSNEV